MDYVFAFGSVFDYGEVLAKGILLTAVLTAVGGVGGIALGLLCAWIRTSAGPWLRVPVAAYIELFRNTPFLIQLFFIFFGLPAAGVQLGEMQAACLAMVANLGAYGAEIIRAGIQATPKGQYEAGASLALSRAQVFRHVVLQPAMARIWPALSSQVVIVMLGSAVCSQIAVEELTFAANFIQSRNFRAFEAYLVTTVIYLVLAILLRALLRQIGARIFQGPRP